MLVLEVSLLLYCILAFLFPSLSKSQFLLPSLSPLIRLAMFNPQQLGSPQTYKPHTQQSTHSPKPMTDFAHSTLIWITDFFQAHLFQRYSKSGQLLKHGNDFPYIGQKFHANYYPPCKQGGTLGVQYCYESILGGRVVYNKFLEYFRGVRKLFSI